MLPKMLGLRRPRLMALVFAALATACGEQPSFTDSGGAYRVPGSSDASRAKLPAESSQIPDSPPAPQNPPTETERTADQTVNAEGAPGSAEAVAAANANGAPGVDVTAGIGSDPATKGTPGKEDLVLGEKAKRLPKFGLLVNDLECSLCHVTVIGDVASTRRVPPLWYTSDAHIEGRWLAAQAFDAARPDAGCTAEGCLGTSVSVTATGGITANYRGAELPLDTTGDGVPDFPALDFTKLPALMRGTVTTTGAFPAAVAKVHQGNLILVGTASKPIALSGDVLVTGDLVIKGRYTGTGSIYVMGNIYIPSDLRAVRSAFPYADDETLALAKATAQMAAMSTDALGLATQGSIFIGDIQKHQNSDAGNEAVNVYNHPATPANRRGEALGVLGVLGWFPGGSAEFDKLYENAVSCLTQEYTQIGSFNMVEAFLYAKNTVAGISRRASYTIRGGIIADYFHIVQGASKCGTDRSPVHGRPNDRSYIEYDYRLKTGLLRVLEHVGDLFPKAGP